MNIISIANDVSVIIPTHNRAHLICETIDSILTQSLLPKEIIVVDDNSTDNTLDLLKIKYGDRIILIRSEGKGPSAARNTGFKISTCSYVKFFDSDDIMTKDCIEAQLMALSTSEKKCVYSPYFHGSWDGTQWKVDSDYHLFSYDNMLLKRGLKREMCLGLFICIPSFMFRRSILLDVGPWNPNLTAYEDFEFLWRVAAYEDQPLHIREGAFIYRMHDVQTTNQGYTEDGRNSDKIEMLKGLMINNNLYKLSSLEKYLMVASLCGKESFRCGIRMNIIVMYIFICLVRVRNKIDRMATGHVWRRHHGVASSRNIILSHLNNL